MLGRFQVTLRSRVEPVLRESDGRLLALAEVKADGRDEPVWVGVLDPRLEPGEEGYEDD